MRTWFLIWLGPALPIACSGDPASKPFDSNGSADATGDSAATGGTTDASSTSVGTAPTSTTGDSAAEGTTGFIFDLGAMDIGGPPIIPPKCGDLAPEEPTSVGCEFWAVRVPVFTSPFTPPSYGVGVGNPFDNEVVVTFEDSRGPGGTLREVGQVELGPRESQLVVLNGAGSLLPGENHTAPAEGHLANVAFRITSDEPITAMQINPVGGAPSYVPEASMLLPTAALGDVYYGIGYEAYGEGIPFPVPGFSGWVVVIATEDDTTITTAAGEQVIGAFDAFTFAPEDTTGFFLSTDKRVAVFSGTTCSNVPANIGWCDHVEEQLIPVAAWGTHYVGARHPHRIPEINPQPEQVYWRVVAAKDDTAITTVPPVGGGNIVLANAGDYADFNSTVSFVAESDDDHPFMLVQYMSGGQTVYDAKACGGGADPATGDPYMLQMVPTDQWLEQLPFLTDASYARDFVTIIRTSGTMVDLACLGVVPDDRFEIVAGTEYEVANIDLDIDGAGGEGNCVDGPQFITASAPVGIAVGGYDCAASYGYPGGLSLDALWVPPHEPPG
jgi:hypothetical protein